MRKKITIPLPGRPLKGPETGPPIMAALNLLSRRWVLRVLWELRDQPRGFREIQTLCDHMSPDTLSTRLSELKEAGIVYTNEDGLLALTPLGKRLRPTLLALRDWSRDWAKAVENGDVE